jgi:hypothetical protein
VERSYVCGIDVGQRIDPSAVAVIERRQVWRPDGRYSNQRVPQGEPEYRLLYAHRLPLGLPYPAQGFKIAQLLSARAELSDAVILCDITGIGRAAVEAWREHDMPDLRGVVLTAGREVRREGRDLFIAKSTLIQEVQSHLHYRTLKIPVNMPEADAIARECADFQVHYTATGALQWNAKSGSHDDLVIAIALGLYGAAHLSAGADMVETAGF